MPLLMMNPLGQIGHQQLHHQLCTHKFKSMWIKSQGSPFKSGFTGWQISPETNNIGASSASASSASAGSPVFDRSETLLKIWVQQHIGALPDRPRCF